MAATGLTATGTHVVRRGDTLSRIAGEYGTSIRSLAEANGISNPNLIVAGTRLKVPGGGGGSGPGAGTSTYVVRAGDTLAKIASRHGTTVSALASLNRISNPDLIIIGRTLSIPGSSGGGGERAPSPTAPGTSTQRSGQHHTVQPGESLGSIAARYGIAAKDLAAWNGITDGRIYASTRLLLWNPGSLPTVAGGSTGGTHVVARGDSLAAIARRYGTSVSKIAAANGISNPNYIVVGHRLEIPGGGGGSIRCMVPGATFFNDWGFPRSGGRSHAGNDLFAPRGTPIIAPVSGAVSQSTGTIGGRQVRLVDRSGALWFASHMDAFGKGGQVQAGDVIGYVGDSGNAKGSRPHAHVEYHTPEGSALNPYPLLRQVC